MNLMNLLLKALRNCNDGKYVRKQGFHTLNGKREKQRKLATLMECKFISNVSSVHLQCFVIFLKRDVEKQ